MKSGLCPKCGSTDIRSGEFLAEQGGGYTGNRIPVAIASFFNSAAWLDNYACTRCGCVESYIADPKKLAEIAERWLAVPTTQPEPPEGVWPPPPHQPTETDLPE